MEGDFDAKVSARHHQAVSLREDIVDGDEGFGAALGGAHAAPDLGHEQADVVVHAVVRPDPSRTSAAFGASGDSWRDDAAPIAARARNTIFQSVGVSMGMVGD